jgi:hypothetical protein
MGRRGFWILISYAMIRSELEKVRIVTVCSVILIFGKTWIEEKVGKGLNVASLLISILGKYINSYSSVML